MIREAIELGRCSETESSIRKVSLALNAASKRIDDAVATFAGPAAPQPKASPSSPPPTES